MIFTRVDDLDGNGNNRVSYTLVDAPGYTFSVIATRTGVQITGTTPVYTDQRQINQVLVWAYAQFNNLSTQGVSIPQNHIIGGLLWPIGP
jgi:hypothetical protein